MDLTKLDVKTASEKGAVLTLKHPMTGDDLDATVTVIGRDSPSVTAKMRELDRRASGGEKMDDTERGLELLVAVTKDWSGIEFDGKPFAFSAANARKLYADPRTEWVGEQVGPFALRRRNFAQNLPKD